MFDIDYHDRARLFIAESKRLRQEYNKKEERRMLWLGKFAFPKINTRKTKVLFVPPGYHRWYIPVIETITVDDYMIGSTPDQVRHKRDEVELKAWGYNGKRWRAIARFGYYEKDDILIISKEFFRYQKARRLSDGSTWWL